MDWIEVWQEFHILKIKQLHNEALKIDISHCESDSIARSYSLWLLLIKQI